MQIASRLTRYYVEFGNEAREFVGRTETIEEGFTGVVPMPQALFATVVHFYRIVNEVTGLASEWAPITPEPTVGDLLTLSAGRT